MTDLVIRPLGADEATEVFTSLHDPGLVGRAILAPPLSTYRTLDEGGTERAHWTWVAQRDGNVVARAAYWGGREDDAPVLLGWFDFHDADAAVALLRTAPYRTPYELHLPVGWRTAAPVRAAAGARIDAAVRAGYRPLTERLTYRWTPERGVPKAPGRLVFRPEPDDEVILDVLRRVHGATRDAHALAAIEQGGVEHAAKEELEFFHWCPSPRAWWRLACTPGGEVVGLQVPVHNPSGPAVGFIGVLPEHRGRGYGYDLLVECTRDLVSRGAQFIAADTDLGNTAMARAFERAGYPVVRHVSTLMPPG